MESGKQTSCLASTVPWTPDCWHDRVALLSPTCVPELRDGASGTLVSSGASGTLREGAWVAAGEALVGHSARDGAVEAVSLPSLKRRWRVDVRSAFGMDDAGKVFRADLPDRVLFVGGGAVRALSAADGACLWELPIGSDPAAFSDRQNGLSISDAHGVLLVVEERSGKLLTRVDLPSPYWMGGCFTEGYYVLVSQWGDLATLQLAKPYAFRTQAVRWAGRPVEFAGCTVAGGRLIVGGGKDGCIWTFRRAGVRARGLAAGVKRPRRRARGL